MKEVVFMGILKPVPECAPTLTLLNGATFRSKSFFFFLWQQKSEELNMIIKPLNLYCMASK